METKFSWGLGTKTNNMAKVFALLQGLSIAKNRRITNLIVLGDSRIVIQALADNSLPNQMHLRRMIKKIKVLSHSLCKIEVFHVLQKHNSEADQANDTGSTLNFNSLLINGVSSYCPLP